MNFLLAPIYLLYKLWIGLVFWLTLLILYPFFWYLLNDERRFSRAFRLKRIWAWIISTLLFCPVNVEYTASLPRGPFIVVSNHSSYLDTVFMYRAFSRYFLFIGKGELLHWPLFGLFFRKMDIPVERHHTKKAWNALQKAYDAIDRGECVAIYPEGTIPPHAPRMKAFKNGAFRMAIDKQVPIVPVTWTSNYRIMKDPGRVFEHSLPHRMRCVVHKAIQPDPPGSDVTSLRQRVFDQIDSAIPPAFRRQAD